MLLLSSADFLQNKFEKKKSFRNTIIVLSNSLDPARCFVWPGLMVIKLFS